MHISSIIYTLSALILAVNASPIANKPPAAVNPPAALSSVAAPAEPSAAVNPPAALSTVAAPAEPSAAPQANSKPEGQGTDIFDHIPLTSEAIPHLGIEDEAKPQKPHGQCVIA
ncbi:hypothetical protein B0H19DRAFT_1143841 [Mycena capillaripes]|nr:hypothetical protein B0H19DRAFT_1143841 [Mycena capillaripes]